MRTLSIFIETAITEADLREAVIDLGGEWDGVHEGSINGHLLVSLEDGRNLAEWFDENDPLIPPETIGFKPLSHIVIGVFRHRDPAQDDLAVMLAQGVAAYLSVKWGGYIDWEDVVPP